MTADPPHPTQLPAEEIEPLAVRETPTATFDSGRITAVYRYRDTDGRVLAIECNNNSPSFNLTITLKNRTTGAVYWTGTQPAHGGQKIWQEPEIPVSYLTQITNPKPPGGLLWTPTNTITLTLDRV